MPAVAVVHLASASLGLAPFEAFLDSYRRYPAGLDHQLIVVFNGFRDLESAHAAGFGHVVDAVAHQAVCRHPREMDVVLYIGLAPRMDAAFLCFVNSTSEILEEDWLAKLHRHAGRADVGMVSATGSYESHRDAVAGDRTPVVRALRSRAALRTRRAFPAFPNPHLRTNAFMVRPEVLADLRVPELRTKLDAYRFESGRNGMTAQMLRRGLRPLIVGRDGVGYEVEDWPASATFRAGDQRNLLIADTRTREWERADPELKTQLSTASWGRARSLA